VENVLTIDFKKPYAKRLSINPAKQKIFFIQNGIDYDSAGSCCNKKQVQDHYAKVAAKAQATADAATLAAKTAMDEVAAVMKETGVTKTAIKKAAAG
jgi:hypothetical protein